METTKSLCDSYYCRLCAEENKNGTYLFSSGENSDDLSLLINRYLPIKVENNGKMPTTICPGCHIQLEATKSFMDLIIQGQLKLRDLYRIQHDTLQRQEKQRQQLEEALHTVNPKSAVETYTIQSDDTGEKFLIQIFSEGPLFPPEHELALQAEGLEKPRRKRGRPPKQPPPEENEKEDETENTPVDVNDSETGGRKRRKTKAPVRYQGVIEGKEMDRIFKEEGVIDDEDIEPIEMQSPNEAEEVIGRTETETGEDLGQPIFINRQKFRVKTGYFKKRRNKKKYRCEICKKEFLHNGRYEIHKKSHKIHYVCQDSSCKMESESKSIIEQHQTETGHTGISAVEKMDSVGGTVQLPDDIVEKIDIAPSVESTESQFKCEPCNKTFTCKQNLDVHNRALHYLEKPFSCTKCDKSFSYANSLKVHMIRHKINCDMMSVKAYPCETCGKVMQHPSSLMYHREIEHSNGRRFVCNKCNKSFRHRQLLQRHQLVHSNLRPFRCSRCNATFKTQTNLFNHEAVHSEERKYTCNQCGQKFTHRTSLTLHERWHEGYKPFTCDVCHKAFSQKGNLAEHKRIHTGEKPFYCNYCERSFTTSSQFNLHKKRHTGERPYLCQYCSRTFIHKDTFLSHVRRHLNYRPFKCSLCSRAFTEAWALKRHQRVHSGEKPFICEHCGKTFSDSSNRSKHMRTHIIANSIKRIYSPDNKFVIKENIDIKDSSLLHILDAPINIEEQKVGMDVSDLQLTQLVDQQGNPISITTQDGQTVPVVTGSNDENSIQGLLPDGTLIPIEITTMQEKDLMQEVDDSTSLLNQEIPNEINILKEEMIQCVDDSQKLDTNIQFLTGDDGQEVCLVTYAMDENNSVNQDLGIDTFFIQNIKK